MISSAPASREISKNYKTVYRHRTPCLRRTRRHDGKGLPQQRRRGRLDYGCQAAKKSPKSPVPPAAKKPASSKVCKARKETVTKLRSKSTPTMSRRSRPQLSGRKWAQVGVQEHRKNLNPGVPFLQKDPRAGKEVKFLPSLEGACLPSSLEHGIGE
jgi:hypothetical protein